MNGSYLYLSCHNELSRKLWATKTLFSASLVTAGTRAASIALRRVPSKPAISEPSIVPLSLVRPVLSSCSRNTKISYLHKVFCNGICILVLPKKGLL